MSHPLVVGRWMTGAALTLGLFAWGCGQKTQPPASPPSAGVRPAANAARPVMPAALASTQSTDAASLSPEVARKGGPLFGDLTRYKRIVFACDVGGSMLNKFATLKSELHKSVATLTPGQSFNFIFFSGRRPIDLARELLAATPDNKKKADTFLDGMTAIGPTDPLPAIEEAFSQKPDVIFLLTNGDFPDNDAVLHIIRELDADKKVKVCTIAYLDNTNNESAFLELFKTIAIETGGTYRRVNEADLD